MSQIVERLFELEAGTGPDGEPRPVLLGMTPDAKQHWVRFYNEHAEERADLEGDLSAAWSKLEGYAARLALVIHCCRWAVEGRSVTPGAVDAQSIEAGIRLSRWFGNEARRVYAMLEETDEDRERRQAGNCRA